MFDSVVCCVLNNCLNTELLIGTTRHTPTHQYTVRHTVVLHFLLGYTSKLSLNYYKGLRKGYFQSGLLLCEDVTPHFSKLMIIRYFEGKMLLLVRVKELCLS